MSDRAIQSWVNFSTSLHCAGFIKSVWVYQVSGESFMWCREVYRFIWDPAPATASRVEIPVKFIIVSLLARLQASKCVTDPLAAVKHSIEVASSIGRVNQKLHRPNRAFGKLSTTFSSHVVGQQIDRQSRYWDYSSLSTLHTLWNTIHRICIRIVILARDKQAMLHASSAEENVSKH